MGSDLHHPSLAWTGKNKINWCNLYNQKVMALPGRKSSRHTHASARFPYDACGHTFGGGRTNIYRGEQTYKRAALIMCSFKIFYFDDCMSEQSFNANRTVHIKFLAPVCAAHAFALKSSSPQLRFLSEPSFILCDKQNDTHSLTPGHAALYIYIVMCQETPGGDISLC